MNLPWKSYTLHSKLNLLLLFIFTAFLFYSCQDSLDSMSSGEPDSPGSITASSSGKAALTMDVSKTTGDEFKVFDALGFKGKPRMSKFGIRPIHIIHTNDLWKTKRNKQNRWEYVQEAMAEQNAHETDKLKSDAVMVVIQHWPTKGGDADFVQKSTTRFSSLYYDLKQAEPVKQFGYFGSFPVKNWWGNDPSSRRLKIWRSKNNRLKKVSQKFDAFYLKGYTKRKDQNRWVTNMKYLIGETRRISDGQPVYLVLWPQYYNEKRNYIEKNFWEKQLQTAKKYADGVVLWSPHGRRWNENAQWWKSTKQFMEELGEYSAEPKVSDSKFKIFDGTRFRNKPNMSRFGFTPLEIIYATRLWNKPVRKAGRWELPSKKLVKKWANEAHKVNNKLTMINIEHWPTQGSKSEVQKSIKNYSIVYNWFKNERPNMNVGYWSMVPHKIHWRKYPQKKWIKSITKTNKRLSPLANKVDAFFPHAYTKVKDKEGWLINTKYMLKQVQKYRGDKPVYLVLWPQYYSRKNANLDGKYIGKDFWKLQLETARKYADGIVLWFPHKVKWSRAKSAPWWDVTKRFLRGMGK